MSRFSRLAKIIVTSCAMVTGPSAAANDVVIHAGTFIDGVSDRPAQRVSIIIRDDRIVEVQPGFVTPAGAEVIDLSGETVLPGLIDTHVHLQE